MKVTKYPQSNLILELNGKRILIDPGMFTAQANFGASDFGHIDAVFITHQHPDHFDPGLIKQLGEIPVFGNADVTKLANEAGIKVTQVNDREEFETSGIKILPVDLPHCKMLDGTDGPPNTGFVINGFFFHPGDGIELSGLTVEAAGIPITGPTIDNERAWELARSLKVKKIIPIHYSNPKYTPDVEGFAASKPEGVQVFVLSDGESTEL